MKIKMFKAVIIQLTLLFFIPAYSQVSITSRGSTYTQNFNALASSGSNVVWMNNSTIAGWYSNASTYNTVNANTGSLYSYGTNNTSERALGSLTSSNSGIIYYGVRIQNNTCNDLTSFVITYTGEQWRIGGNASTQKIDFQYQLGASDITSGTWTDFDALDFSSLQTAVASAVLDGNAAANRVTINATISSLTLLPGQELWIRWKDQDDVGNDHGLAIDDFSITADGAACHYRTQGSGDWNTAATWEQSDDNLSWTPATSIPSYLNGKIEIENTHSVIITSNIKIDQLTIKEGGVLIYEDYPDSITVNNGTGADFIIEGTFYDLGPKSIFWNNSSTWRMGNNGTLIRTRSTSANAWRDSYDGGITTIPSTANWIVRKTSSDNPSLTGTSMTYPNLTIENMSTNPWSTGLGSIFTGSSSRPIIKGNFDIGGSGTNTVYFLNQNENINPVLVEGSVTVRPLCILRNYGTGIEIKGNLTIDGNLIYGESKSRKIIFSGTLQNISGTGVLEFHELDVQTGAEVVLNTDITVDSLLSIDGGVITTSENNLLTIGSDAQVTALNSAYVNGPIRYTGLNAITFPVGKGGHYRPLSISSSVAGPVDFTCEYFLSNPKTDYDTILSPSLHHISSCEYWLLNRNSGNASKNVTLSWDAVTSCGITDPSALRVAHWDETQWKDEGNTAFTGDNLFGTLTSGLINDFSPLTLASSSPVNPMPVEWLNFTALFKDESVELKWATGLEFNTSHFVIERSPDGVNFNSINTVQAAGNSSSVKHYSSIDHAPLYNMSYYRIKQVDNNGTTSYSKIVSGSIQRTNNLVIETISLDNDFIHIQIKGSNTTPLSFEIIDVLGKRLFEKNVYCENNKQEISIPASFFKQGIYFFRLSDSTNYDVKKFVK